MIARIRLPLAVAAIVSALTIGCAVDATSAPQHDDMEQKLASAELALVEADERIDRLTRELEAATRSIEVAGDLRKVQASWSAAWSARDGAAVVGMMAPGGRHYCPASGPNGLSGADLAAFVAHGYDLTDATIVSAVCTEVPGDPTVAEIDCLVATDGSVNGHSGYTTVLHLRGVEGTMRVVDHHAYP